MKSGPSIASVPTPSVAAMVIVGTGAGGIVGGAATSLSRMVADALNAAPET